ncbi:ribosome maturation factor RimP [Actinomyces massiliensis]|jgi:ribosome maturation factor rimP|uniref:ribosome maturation factor RimP n=1 Tax=Actinomyces massiliensis TaxID=461393 RepID=UPI0002F68687|nr:ribosome maturation factor RimP [Actinomyces massiliensis]
MADAIARRLTELLTPVVEGAGAFLEGIKTTRAGKYSTVRVLVDLPDGPGELGLDALTEVSRAVSAALDEADPVKGRYTLEVSTPGAERELSTPRHFRRAVGHDVELTVEDTEGAEDTEDTEGAEEAGNTESTEGDGAEAGLTRLTGTVAAADDDSVTLRIDGHERVVSLDDIRQARMVVIF